jgi:uncharacterized protein YycO
MSEQLGKILQSQRYNVNNEALNNVITLEDIKKARNVASKLVTKLNDPTSFKFFCKISYKLPENKIWSAYEQALTGRNPKAYFTFLCKLELGE